MIFFTVITIIWNETAKARYSSNFVTQLKEGLKSAENYRDINETFGEELASEWPVRKLFKRFWSENLNHEIPERGGLNDDSQLKIVIEKDLRMTTRELAQELQVSHKTAYNHLHAYDRKIKKARQIGIRNLKVNHEMRKHDIF